MWSSKKTAAAPPSAIAGPSSASSTVGRNTFSVLQPTLVNNTSQGSSNSNFKGKNSNTNREPWIGRLPASLHSRVLSYLPVPDIPRYAAACKQLNRLVRNDVGTWKVKCEILGVTLDSMPSQAETEGRERQHGDEPGMTGFGLGITTTNTNGNGEGNRHRIQGSVSTLKSMTNPSATATAGSGMGKPGAFVFEDNDNDEDDFGDFNETITTTTTTTSSTIIPGGSPVRRDDREGGGLLGPTHHSAAVSANNNNNVNKMQMKNSGTPNLMDFSDGFDDLDFDFGSVPMPSNDNYKSPEKARGGKGVNPQKSGFFALPAVNMLDPRTKTQMQGAGNRRPMDMESGSSLWYEAYKRVHTQLMPYVRILRTTSSSSTSASQEGGGGSSTKTNLTPTQTLALLFPSSHSPDSPVPGPLPLVDQADVLARLVLLLTPLIEPCADWAWLRRVLVGGGGVVDRWDGGCLSGFEGLERRVRSSGGVTAGPGIGPGADAVTGVDEKLVQEMRRVAGASWKVYTSLARSKALSSPSSSRSRIRSNGSGKGTGISFTAGLGGWGGIGGTDADEAGWELGRVWVEKREVFYESGSGGKWDSGENIV